MLFGPYCRAAVSSIGVPELLRTVVREDGFRALYRGVTPSLMGIIPYAGIAFSINEQAKHEVRIGSAFVSVASFSNKVPTLLSPRKLNSVAFDTRLRELSAQHGQRVLASLRQVGACQFIGF